jgi:predicted small lipoprotein YifL
VARFVLALAALLFLAGCGSDAPENSAPTSRNTPAGRCPLDDLIASGQALC